MLIAFTTKKADGYKLRLINSPEKAACILSKTRAYLETVDLDKENESINLHCHKCAGTEGSVLDLDYRDREEDEFYLLLSEVVMNPDWIPGDSIATATLVLRDSRQSFCTCH